MPWRWVEAAYVVDSSSCHSDLPFHPHCCQSLTVPRMHYSRLPSLSAAAAAVGRTMTSSTDAVTSSAEVMTSSLAAVTSSVAALAAVAVRDTLDVMAAGLMVVL